MDDPFVEAGQEVHKRLQELLNEKVGGNVLAKVALRIKQGLNAKVTKLASYEGKFKDTRHLVDFGERGRYVDRVIDIFGARAPMKHWHSGEGGGPVLIMHMGEGKNLDGDGNKSDTPA